MRYISKPTEVEAMQWEKDGNTWRDERQLAGDIAHWVEANGGEAYLQKGTQDQAAWRIVVRTINGWAYAAPGHYVVMGEATFWRYNIPADGFGKLVRDFHPCAPETFERRWEPAR